MSANEIYKTLDNLTKKITIMKDMINISRQIIKKDKSIKKNDFVIITAGLPFGNATMTNMIRLYKVGS